MNPIDRFLAMLRADPHFDDKAVREQESFLLDIEDDASSDNEVRRSQAAAALWILNNGPSIIETYDGLLRLIDLLRAGEGKGTIQLNMYELTGWRNHQSSGSN